MVPSLDMSAHCNNQKEKAAVRANNLDCTISSSPVSALDHYSIAVLIPCYNEELTICQVVKDFLEVLPTALIYVYDNNSTDRSVSLVQELIAANTGEGRVILRHEVRQGKGNVIRAMFRDIEADAYLLVDADCTYDPKIAPHLVAQVTEQHYDMVIGDRLSSTYFAENKRAFHSAGNVLVRKLINVLFKRRRTEEIHDIMTGYRVFSRDFVKTCPILSRGFEVETEITIHALEHNLKICSIPIVYHDRPQGSVSKLNTLNDGCKVLLLIFNLLRVARPLLFFMTGALFCFVPAVALLIPVLSEYFATGFVSKVPSFVASGIFLLLSVFCAFTGLILDTLKRNQRCEYELIANLMRQSMPQSQPQSMPQPTHGVSVWGQGEPGPSEPEQGPKLCQADSGAPQGD